MTVTVEACTAAKPAGFNAVVTGNGTQTSPWAVTVPIQDFDGTPIDASAGTVNFTTTIGTLGQNLSNQAVTTVASMFVTEVSGATPGFLEIEINATNDPLPVNGRFGLSVFAVDTRGGQSQCLAAGVVTTNQTA